MSVYKAILSLRQRTWNELARDVFGIEPETLMPETVLAKVMETGTCSNLDDPVDVWIDEEGYYSLKVFSSAPSAIL